jgi:hypothetical protein|eukprot:COSAG01_NODE_5126_length_4469_cov_14.074600_9_plen_72_part_00
MSKWHAYVTISGGTNFSVGYFAGEEEAAHARDAGARKSSDTAGVSSFVNAVTNAAYHIRYRLAVIRVDWTV